MNDAEYQIQRLTNNIQLALEQGSLLLCKEANNPVNLGKKPARVLAELLLATGSFTEKPKS